MGGPDVWDNAAAESFFATSTESCASHLGDTAHAKRTIVRWIEGWYNPRRLHSSIDYLTPNEKENAWHTADRQARNDLSVKAGQLQGMMRRARNAPADTQGARSGAENAAAVRSTVG